MGKKGLYENINARKKVGTSRPKNESTISKKAYKNMQEGFPKKMENSGEARRIAKGCGKVMSNRRKKTKYS
jgi:hypothetical protein